MHTALFYLKFWIFPQYANEKVLKKNPNALEIKTRAGTEVILSVESKEETDKVSSCLTRFLFVFIPPESLPVAPRSSFSAVRHHGSGSCPFPPVSLL